MNSRVLGIGALCAGLCVFGLAGPSRAADPPRPVTLELAQVPLAQVIQLLSMNGNVEIVINDPAGMLADRKITYISIKNKSIEKALEIVCTSAEVHYFKDKDGIYYISAQPIAREATRPSARPDSQPAARSEAPLPLPEPVETVIEKIILDFLDVNQCLQMITTSHVKKPLAEAARARSLEELDVYPGLVDPSTGSWFMPQAGAIYQPGAGRGAGQGVTGGNQFGGGGFGGGGMGGFGGGGMGGFGGGGMGGMGGGMMGGMGGGMGGMGGGMGGFGGGLGGGGGGAGNLVPQNIQAILGYPLDNSLIVRGTPEDIEDLKRIIRLLDIPPRQINIKIEQIAVISSFQKQFGIDWNITHNDIDIRTGIGLATGGAINVGILGDNWRANFAAAESAGKATTINSANITTFNNVTAFLITGTTTYIFLPNIQQVQGAGLVTTYTPQALQATTTLIAQPRVNGDNTITMLIPFSLARFLGESVGPDGQRIPNTVFSTVFALRRVASGQTIVVGGSLDRDDSNTRNGIPILQNLPFIGRLFQSKQQTRRSSETLFFFTPTLLPEEVGVGGPIQ